MEPLTTLDWRLPHRAEIAAGLTVGRLLPFKGGRGVGPFVFLDHIGPHTFAPNEGTDVLSHPHIGLATVTYLFEGFLDHRDSLGTVQRIKPGEVNWMTAGSGIVHSERSPTELRDSPQPFHGVQAWVALPLEHEETPPSFEHVGGEQLPCKVIDGVRIRLVAGRAFGLESPVRTHSRLFYVHTEFPAGSKLEFNPDGQEAALFMANGRIRTGGQTFDGPGLLRFPADRPIVFEAETPTNGMLLGGDPLRGHRRIWWNFVSSRPERIEEAKRQWRDGKFPKVPGESGFVPLPG